MDLEDGRNHSIIQVEKRQWERERFVKVCYDLIIEELIKMTRDWKGLDGIPVWVLLILIVMIVIAFLFIICFVR